LTLNNGATLDGLLVTTSGAQNYKGAVTLGADTTLTAGGGVDFVSTVDGGQALTVEGATTFGGAVGGGTRLSALTLDDAANLDGGIIDTTGAQNYNGIVTLGANTTMNASAIFYKIKFIDGSFSLTATPPPQGLTPVIIDPVTGDPVIIDNGAVVLDLEGVIRGIFGTVAEQPATVSSVPSATSQEKSEIPPGAYLKRSGEITIK